MPALLDPSELEPFVHHHPLALVEVWAEWSGSAYLVSSLLDRLLREASHRVVARGRIDVSAHPEILTRFGLEGAPAVLMFRDGRLVDRLSGLVNAEVLSARLRVLEAPNPSEDSP